MTETFDYLIIGGGIFGAFAAQYLAPHTSVALVEKEPSLLTRASKINQTRLHTGTHYLRAPRTASDARRHHDRFIREHQFAINQSFRHIYAIARQGSLTDAGGFERFCQWLDIEATHLPDFELLDPNRISDSYLVKEPSFDPFLLTRHYATKLEELDLQLHLSSQVISAQRGGDAWLVQIENEKGERTCIQARSVINATYSNLNSISKIFHLPAVKIKHEYSELLLAYVPSLQDLAITIMDGPFLSITPYGMTGLHVLSSVVYTHHASTENSGQLMPCQIANGHCSVDAFDRCQPCKNKPESSQKFMLNQLRSFVPNIGSIFIHGQVETVKSTWAVEDYRDERQTSIRKLESGPDFYTVMSGKVSNIYELEYIFDAK